MGVGVVTYGVCSTIGNAFAWYLSKPDDAMAKQLKKGSSVYVNKNSRTEYAKGLFAGLYITGIGIALIFAARNASNNINAT